jgi:hypothetical protein
LTDEPVMEVAMVQLILLVLAFVLALVEAFTPYWWTAPTRPHLGWLALAFYFLSIVLSQGHI